MKGRSKRQRRGWRRLTARRPRMPDARVISYPKSGRTWLRALMGRALCESYGLDPKLILDTASVTAATGGLRTDFSHEDSDIRHRLDHRALRDHKRAYRDCKVIFMTRDPRDVLVSSYFEVTRRRGLFEIDPPSFDGTLSDFIRSPVFGASKMARFYEIWDRNRDVPRQFLLVRYERLHVAPVEVLGAVLRFIGVDVPRERLVEAVDFASFDGLRALEASDAFDDPALRPGDPADPDSYKVRRGRVGGYVDYLSEADVAYIDEQFVLRGAPFQA